VAGNEISGADDLIVVVHKVADSGPRSVSTLFQKGGSCGGLPMQAQHSKGNEHFWLCNTGTSFISAEYYFTNSKKKRAVGQKCERVSRLGLEDGSVYDIADMSDADLEELVCLRFRPCFKQPKVS
jgi:hypothetical protein